MKKIFAVLVCSTAIAAVGATVRELHTHAARGDTERVKSILRSDPLMLNLADEDGRTALIRAAECDSVELVDFLLSKGAKVDHADAAGRTALMIAAGIGNSRMCELLLEKGADINRADRSGRTALEYAYRREWHHTAEFLILKGAAIDIDRPDEKGATALMNAAKDEDLKEISALLAKGADVNRHRAADGATPLTLAAAAGRAKACERLLAGGADVDEPDRTGMTALHHAVASGSVDCIRLLLKKGADPNFECRRGVVALYKAVEKNDLDAIDALIQGGIDMEDYGETAMTKALENGKKETIAHLMNKYGLEVSGERASSIITSRMESESLHDWIEFIQNNRIKVNIGWVRLLQVAAAKNDTDRIKFLLTKVKAKDVHPSALMMHYHSLPEDERKRKDLEVKEAYPLTYYIKCNPKPDMATVRRFLDAGFCIYYPDADVEIKPKDGIRHSIKLYEKINVSPLALAVKNNDLALVELLSQAKVYCEKQDMRNFRSFLRSKEVTTQDAKMRNGILRLIRKLKKR